MNSVETIAASRLGDDAMLQCFRLWDVVWPTGDAPARESRMEELIEFFDSLDGHFFHLALADGEVVAVARTFLRRIEINATEVTVTALASVCSHPTVRGLGRGDAVTTAAFERVDSESTTALFQTAVPRFYERHGACVIDNEITSSAPDARLFHDPYVMVYPGRIPWESTAVIDLVGSGW